MKKLFKVLLKVILAVLILAVGYLAYVFISYHRLGNMELVVSKPVDNLMEEKKEYRILSYNIGFGAYEPDFSFFMDGGERSWAWSKDRLRDNINNIANFLKDRDADIYMLQEVDTDSTRTYHIDESAMITDKFEGYTYTFAQNYDSPFLFYPFTQPHGSSKSGIITISRYKINSSERVELPIEESLMKILDLDRCFCVNRFKLSSGKELVVIAFHLSAYTSDGSIATVQLENVIDVMQKEYEKGNYVIAGGDFNKDVTGNSVELFNVKDMGYSWAKPLPKEAFEGKNVKVVSPVDSENPIPTCRDTDAPYHGGQYVTALDGFMITDNIKASDAKVIDTKFLYSDHNPVTMTFELD